MSQPAVVPTEHYIERCAQRQIPTDAAAVLLRFGRPIGPGHGEDREVYELSADCGPEALRPYRGVRVVVAERHVAVTAYRRRRLRTVRA